MSENVTTGAKMDRFRDFFPRRVLVFRLFFQISDVHAEPYAGGHIRDKFHANLPGDSIN